MKKVFLNKLLRPLFLIFGVWLILSIGSEDAQGKNIKKVCSLALALDMEQSRKVLGATRVASTRLAGLDSA